MPDRVEWVTEPARFSGLAPAWDHLAQAAPDPFSRHAWYTAWWDGFGRGRLQVCTVWSGDELRAGFPLQATRAGLEALANVHSPAFRPVAADAEARATVLRAVVASPGFSSLLVPALPCEEGVVTDLAAAARAAGRPHLVEPQHVSPIVAAGGTFEEYRRERKAKLAEYERRRRKLQREHDVELVVAQQPDALDALDARLREGMDVEASGWKGSRGTAMASSDDTARFYRSMAEGFHALGLLRLSWLRVDGRMVAFDLALVDRGAYFLLKTGYAEAARRLAPGMVLRLAVVERCIETGLRHEFLGGDMPWKRVFATAERRHESFRAYGSGPVGILRRLYRARVRPVLKEVRRRAGRAAG